MKRDAHLGITVHRELHDKFKYISAYDGRSMSNHILFLMQKAVREFEAAHGPIELSEEER